MSMQFGARELHWDRWRPTPGPSRQGAMAEEAHRLATTVTGHTGLVEPERYFGEPDRLNSFVNHLCLKYELEAGRFPSEWTKVLHCPSCMGGATYEWAMVEFHCSADCCQTFEKFTEELTLMFNPASLHRSVASRWFCLSQEGRTVFNYVLDFCTLGLGLAGSQSLRCPRQREGVSVHPVGRRRFEGHVFQRRRPVQERGDSPAGCLQQRFPGRLLVHQLGRSRWSWGSRDGIAESGGSVGRRACASIAVVRITGRRPVV